MPAPAFSKIKKDDDKTAEAPKSPQRINKPASAPGIVFGEALAQGLPQSWTPLPPTAGMIQKKRKNNDSA